MTTDQTRLEKHLARLGHVPPGANWTLQQGGRTNRVWRVAAQGGDLICKLYQADDANPMFPNLAEAEFAALTALKGKNIAPAPLACLNTDVGRVVLYRHVTGTVWAAGSESIATLLAKIHQPYQGPGLRHLASGSAALIHQITTIRAACRQPGPGPVFPAVEIPACDRPVLIHTDVVPSNIIVSADGPRLIDWQCPAIGDPCEDLASFLSPAMQHLYGSGPLSVAEVGRFLAAYPDQKIVARYRKLAPLFHRRVAAYCQWKVERGFDDYRQAQALELSAIDHADRQKEQAGQ